MLIEGVWQVHGRIRDTISQLVMSVFIRNQGDQAKEAVGASRLKVKPRVLIRSSPTRVVGAELRRPRRPPKLPRGVARKSQERPWLSNKARKAIPQPKHHLKCQSAPRPRLDSANSLGP